MARPDASDFVTPHGARNIRRSDRPHLCGVGGCGSSYSAEESLINHYKLVDDAHQALYHQRMQQRKAEKPHGCPRSDCYKSYTEKAGLNKHLKESGHDPTAPAPAPTDSATFPPHPAPLPNPPAPAPHVRA